MTTAHTSRAIAVYCGSSLGTHRAYYNAAVSLGRALAAADRPLVYGGGSQGIMGVVSGTVLENGGRVTGVMPFAMAAKGGEKEKVGTEVDVDFLDRKNVETIIVDSMHERKVEMAKRVEGFIGLPGGFGTFEEILEVATWTQIGIHLKPVIVLNILAFWDPLRQLIKNSIEGGYVRAENRGLIVFVDGPEDLDEHENFDWGNAGIKAIETWEKANVSPLFDWTKRMNEGEIDDNEKLKAA